MRDKERKPILAIDFDGVIHSYASGWKGARNIPDKPVEGAIEWLKSIIGIPENICAMHSGPDKFQVCIFSSRSRYLFGVWAMKRWLKRHGMTKYEIELIKFPKMKPASFLLIDDRAINFNGHFPSENWMLNFKPWYLRS